MKFKPNPEYRLMDQVREILRYYHYAYRTEQPYSSWILQYIKFYGGKDRTVPSYLVHVRAERAQNRMLSFSLHFYIKPTPPKQLPTNPLFLLS